MHVFEFVADHQYSIPEGSYALVGSDPYDSGGTLQEQQFWVIGDRFPGRKFRKVSVFQIPNKEDVERLHTNWGLLQILKLFLYEVRLSLWSFFIAQIPDHVA